MDSGILGYYRKLARQENGGQRVNRARIEGLEVRELRKLTGPSTWFRKEPKNYIQEDEWIKEGNTQDERRQ